MAKTKVSTELAKALNASMRQLLDVSEDAVARIEASGADEFVSSNYRQAIISFSFLMKYVRDFAGAASTAPIEDNVQKILDTVTPPKLQVVAEDVEKFKTKRGKKSDG